MKDFEDRKEWFLDFVRIMFFIVILMGGGGGGGGEMVIILSRVILITLKSIVIPATR